MTPVLAAAVKNIRCAMEGKIFASRTLLVIFISLLFLSCDLFDTTDSSTVFYAKNITTGRDYTLKAELLASGAYCNVWVEKGSGVSKTQAKNFADRYDSEIHKQMISAFGIANPTFFDGRNNRSFSDIMKFADYLGDGDGKLCILLLDIKDSYKEGVNNSYVAGYFWAGNFFSPSQIPGSNRRDMIYIDTYPAMKSDIESVFTTLAHEMQHMINFVTSILLRADLYGEDAYIDVMDTWIDEGLSSAAEYIVGKKHLEDRISWYNENGSSRRNMKGLIDEGNNFFVWDNHQDNQYAILDDYATVYLFFQWLRIQNGGNDIYRKIISSEYPDHQAVEAATNVNWNVLLRNWMAANYIYDSTGIYGYKNDIPESGITINTVPSGMVSVDLYPGEGVYSVTDSTDTMPAQGINIRYAGLNKTSGVNDNNIYSSGVLLTYNINTVLIVEGANGKPMDSPPETGTTTGKAASVNIAQGRSAVSSYSGLYRIGIADLLSQYGGNRGDFTPRNIQDKLREVLIVK